MAPHAGANPGDACTRPGNGICRTPADAAEGPVIDPATLIYQAGVTTIDRALPKGRRLYVFNPKSWDGAAYQAALAEAEKWR